MHLTNKKIYRITDMKKRERVLTRETDRQTETEKQRETERDKNRETESDRDRERETDCLLIATVFQRWPLTPF